MNEDTDNSSLPLLLSITGAVLVVAVGGWFYFNREPAAAPPQDVADVAEVADVSDVTPTEPAESGIVAEPDVAEAVADDTTPDVDAELRKARLAAGAEMLVLPVSQSALHYYGRVLQANPRHAIAIAELDAVLSSVAQTVTQHLNDKEYESAYEIATLVAKLDPEHQLVIDTQQTLDRYTERLVAEAIQLVQEGEDDESVAVLATAEALPGRNPVYFAAVRNSIEEIQTVRVAAERDKEQRDQLAVDEAKAAWTGAIEQAIAQGNLISPAGASARDLLAESNSWTAERSRMTNAVLSALVDTAKVQLDKQSLNDAEALTNAAMDLGGSSGSIEELRARVEAALIEAESNRLVTLKELVQTESASPRYPRRAQERATSGWVEIQFTVSESGETTDIQVTRAEPKNLFDKVTIEAVEKWAFEPVEYRGQIIRRRAAARLVFAIE